VSNFCKNPPLLLSWHDLSSHGPVASRRVQYRVTGRENARVSSGGEQRVTRGSILYRGRWSPAGNRDVFPYARSLPFAANGSGGQAATPKPSGDTPRTSWGLYHCTSPSAPSYIPSSGSVPTRVDFLQIILNRAPRRNVGAPTFVCVIMRKMLGYF